MPLGIGRYPPPPPPPVQPTEPQGWVPPPEFREKPELLTAIPLLCMSLIFPSVVPSNNRRRLSFCVREHSCGQSPALLDPIRCATMHRNGSGTSVSRYPQPTDLIWMPAGSLRQRSVHQVQPAGVVFRDSDGPKAFRIRRTGPAAPGKGGGRSRTTVNHIPNPWFNSSSLKFGVCGFC